VYLLPTQNAVSRRAGTANRHGLKEENLMISRSVPPLVVAALSLLVVSPGGRAGDPEGPAADRIKAVRTTYERVPPTILGIKEPIRVTQCADQAEPVVSVLVLVDADETYHHVDWWLDKRKFQNAEYDRMYWLYYKGLRGERKGKFRLAVRSPEEAALYGLLLRWATAKEKEKNITLFDKGMVKNVNGLLKKLDERFAAEKPVLQK
jgi:hypothetical protein